MPDVNLTEQDKKIAAKLRTRRKLLGISIERIAFVISHSVEQYVRYESAEERIMPNLLFELATLLNVQLEYFYDDFE